MNGRIYYFGTSPTLYLKKVEENGPELLDYIKRNPENVMNVFKYVNISRSTDERILKYVGIVYLMYSNTM